jgi:hypothetical protein
MMPGVVRVSNQQVNHTNRKILNYPAKVDTRNQKKSPGGARGVASRDCGAVGAARIACSAR